MIKKVGFCRLELEEAFLHISTWARCGTYEGTLHLPLFNARIHDAQIQLRRVNIPLGFRPLPPLPAPRGLAEGRTAPTFLDARAQRGVAGGD